MNNNNKIYVLYTKGPLAKPEGKFLAELISQADAPGFFIIRVRVTKEELIVSRQQIELDWIKQ